MGTYTHTHTQDTMGSCHSEPCQSCTEPLQDLISKQTFLIIPANTTCAICLEGVEENEGVPVVDDDADEKNHSREQPVDNDEQPNSSTASEPQVRIPQGRNGGPWVRLDCGHMCHSACIQARVAACSKRHADDKFTFGHLTCAVCRQDLAITDQNQRKAMRLLRNLLKPGFETRAKVQEALRKHALEDPVDRIEGIEDMPEHEADALIQRRIGAFECTNCKDIFCEGIECAARDDEAEQRDDVRCPRCVLASKMGASDYSNCPEPLYKCDLCCSVAKYRCPDYYQCEMHHSGAKTIHLCPGAEKCPLGVEHPQNAHVRTGFIIGCGCGKCK